MATVTDTVEVVAGPLPDAAALDARLEELRRRFPRDFIDRYLALLPTFAARVLVAPGAAVAGDVRLADNGPCVVGADVIVGHRAMLHACRVEDACLIGMQATVLDDAVIGAGSVVGAGAVVTQRTIIPPRSLVLGGPAKVVKTLTEMEEAFLRAHAAN